MTWKEATSWARAHRPIVIIIAALSALALASAYGAWNFRAKLQESKQAEKAAREESKAIQREGEIQREAYRSAIGATEPALKSAMQGVREARTSLAQAEASRRELWNPPAIDNLAARFDRAVEGLR